MIRPAPHAPRNKGVICEAFNKRDKSCKIADCPYAHIAKGEEHPVPDKVCTFFRSNKCYRDGCKYFHGSEEQLQNLRASKAVTYLPEKYMEIADPLDPAAIMQQRREQEFHQLQAPPPIIPGMVPFMMGAPPSPFNGPKAPLVPQGQFVMAATPSGQLQPVAMISPASSLSLSGVQSLMQLPQMVSSSAQSRTSPLIIHQGPSVPFQAYPIAPISFLPTTTVQPIQALEASGSWMLHPGTVVSGADPLGSMSDGSVSFQPN